MKHEFALYIMGLSTLIKSASQGDTITITEEKIAHRIMTVLRLSPNEECIFFDQYIHIQCIIKEFIGKKQVLCTIQQKKINTILSPSLTFLLPLLKRDDFENAIYSLTELGATTIQLVVTQKTHDSSFNQKDMDRAQRIIIAAAEQSKNFSYPTIKTPISLLKIIDKLTTPIKIFFDPQGKSFASITQYLLIESPNDIVLLVGPEGDLSNEEKEMITLKNFIACALTPTILRSVQAAVLGTGLVRSLLK
jgi:16S rRNA (uracil1498-N3)-methyltransferase